jgi:hypothetical protein
MEEEKSSCVTHFKEIFRQNRSAAEKDCLWQPEG